MITRPDDDEVTRLAMGAARGDRHALEAFVQATRDDVWRFVGYLADRRMADDLTQDTYLRAIRSMPSFRAGASGRTWLLAIARRTVADHFRRAASRPVLDLTSPENIAVVARSTRHDDHVELEMLVESLDKPRREAFVLTQILGIPYADAATICSCPVGTIRSRVARARDDLMAAYRAGERHIG
ncbi:sigma-70 family RNA polymerase sigma factor [Gordonia sp. Z-3]|uniref:RNA polymerase sigma factor n=1 Tax=Gordonia aquimaris TaxID=2984863 RepID=A0A9X3I4C3_9ACTN|nr:MULTISPECIES: sigma-70 family RNA polymerase sigma factor [Gordonia]MCX2964558.1 sigma-70 family RNA polymerase sigma factor [Gordonia aquimaris]MED5799420.1 sigma-70 family RNA polymerase sigma factor [Gordonia sp. Z-3]